MRHKIGFVLTLLLVIQLFALAFIPNLVGSDYYLYIRYTYVYVILSYLVIAIIFLLEIENLQKFHIDTISFWMIILNCFLRVRLGGNEEKFFLIILAILGCLMTVMFIKNRSLIAKTSLDSLVKGVIVGCGVLAVITFIEAFQVEKWLSDIYANKLGINILRQLIFQFSFVVLIEEVVFRGFLAGYLMIFGLREKTAFSIQALLFWLIHYRRLTNPITFFISIPILAISTTLVVKRQKQLLPSIFVHLMVNVLSPLLLNIFF